MTLTPEYESDGITPLYFTTAREHEETFRGILTHIKSNGIYMPPDFDVDEPIEQLLDRVNPQDSYGRFVVNDFLVGPRENSLLIEDYGELALDQSLIYFQNIAALSGAVAIYQYSLDESGKPDFDKALMFGMS